jgi:hypothetical protein
VCAILTDLRKDTVLGVVADCIVLMGLGLSLLQERNGIRQSVTGALEESYYMTPGILLMLTLAPFTI